MVIKPSTPTPQAITTPPMVIKPSTT
jgi:hypothetical protein